MSDDIKVKDARNAIEQAFRYFDDFMTKGSLSNQLLEGVKYLDPNWQIVIGYDIGSNIETFGIIGSSEKTTPRRMQRTLIIAEADGSLIELK